MGEIERFPLRAANDNVDVERQRELFFSTPLTYENLPARLPVLAEWFSIARIPDDATEAFSQVNQQVSFMSEVHLIEFLNERLPLLLRDSSVYQAIRDEVTLQVTAAVFALHAYKRLI